MNIFYVLGFEKKYSLEFGINVLDLEFFHSVWISPGACVLKKTIWTSKKAIYILAL